VCIKERGSNTGLSPFKKCRKREQMKCLTFRIILT
jgi:hypothetical protein